MQEIISWLLEKGKCVILRLGIGGQCPSCGLVVFCRCSSSFRGSEEDWYRQVYVLHYSESNHACSRAPRLGEESHSSSEAESLVSNQPLRFVAFHDNFYDGWRLSSQSFKPSTCVSSSCRQCDCRTCGQYRIRSCKRNLIRDFTLVVITPCRTCGASVLCPCRYRLSDLSCKYSVLSCGQPGMTDSIGSTSILAELQCHVTCSQHHGFPCEASLRICTRSGHIHSLLKLNPDYTNFYITNYLSDSWILLTVLKAFAVNISSRSLSQDRCHLTGHRSWLSNLWYCSHKAFLNESGSPVSCACLRQILLRAGFIDFSEEFSGTAPVFQNLVHRVSAVVGYGTLFEKVAKRSNLKYEDSINQISSVTLCKQAGDKIKVKFCVMFPYCVVLPVSRHFYLVITDRNVCYQYL